MYMNSWKHMQYIQIYDTHVLITNQREHELLNIFRNSCLKNFNMNAFYHEKLLNKVFRKLTYPQYWSQFEKESS